MERKILRYGQIGGTLNAFIGGVHRKALAFNEQAILKAGCFSSSNQATNRACGDHYFIDPERIYNDYKSMAEAEAQKAPEERLDFVVISTPNNTHYDIAKTFMQYGFNIVCEKPLCFSSSEAEELYKMSVEKNLLFCVTYTYTGYNMVKQAKQIVQSGQIGQIVDVKGEYLQDWLIGQLEDGESETNLSVWRMNPTFSGSVNCVGDIGTHIEDTVAYITGLRVKRLAATMDNFGKKLDLNANILVEFDNGAHGHFACSQVAAGHYNGLRIRVFGTKGSLEWEQEHPDFLKLTLKDQPSMILTRAAHSTDHALELNRIPSGHPEGLTVAFANIYKTYCDALLRKINNDGKNDGPWDLDFPSAFDGFCGVKFIEACVRSSQNGSVWTDLR